MATGPLFAAFILNSLNGDGGGAGCTALTGRKRAMLMNAYVR
jgi:hypothetical protein